VRNQVRKSEDKVLRHRKRESAGPFDGVLAEVGVAEEIASAILCDLVRCRGTDPTFLDAVKSKYLQKHGSRAKLRPETNEWT
jgi:hypothetical protein